MIDAVGEIRPSSQGMSFIYHASCPFSHWTWISAQKKNDAETWARWLVEEVYFDLAGFSMVLRSGQGVEFVAEIVHSINEMLGVEQAFGATYHPQSQGHVEAAPAVWIYLIN